MKHEIQRLAGCGFVSVPEVRNQSSFGTGAVQRDLYEERALAIVLVERGDRTVAAAGPATNGETHVNGGAADSERVATRIGPHDEDAFAIQAAQSDFALY